MNELMQAGRREKTKPNRLSRVDVVLKNIHYSHSLSLSVLFSPLISSIDVLPFLSLSLPSRLMHGRNALTHTLLL